MSERAAAAILALVVLISVGVALAWVAIVPIYQAADENAHLDYALSIYSAGRLITARDRPEIKSDVAVATHPFTKLLEARTAFDVVIHRPQVRMPVGYGSKDFYRAIDQAAGTATTAQDLNPMLLTRYPFGYYALIALVLSATHHLGAGLVVMFYAARLTSVALFAAGLVLSHHICRELNVSRERSLVIVAAMGVFPLSSFVASYIQPDNLTFLLVSANLYTALRLKRTSHPLRLALIQGVLLGLLLITKYQFYLCLLAAITAMWTFSRRPRLELSQAARGLGLMIWPSLILASVQAWVASGGRSEIVLGAHLDRPINVTEWSLAAVGSAARGGPGDLAAYLLHWTLAAFQDFFLLGPTNLSFWGDSGWMDTILVIGSIAITIVARAIIAGLGLCVLALVVARCTRTLRAVGRLGRRRRLWSALGLTFSDPTATSLLLFAAVMLGLYVLTADTIAAQGRNWFPLLLPIFLMATVSAPRALPKPWLRRAVANSLLGGLLVYSLIGGVASIGVLQSRYYGSGRIPGPSPSPRSLPLAREPAVARFTYIAAPFPIPESGSDSAPSGGHLAVGGWALDTLANRPAKAVFVQVDDGEPQRAAYGSPGSCGPCGFDVILTLGDLSPGRHELRIEVIGVRGIEVYESAPVSFSVV